MNPILSAVILTAAVAATPALAQSGYGDDGRATTMPPASSDLPPQQAQTPDEPRRRGEVETLRQGPMSSPNVRGETVPEVPATGLPAPEGRDAPKRLESTPRP